MTTNTTTNTTEPTAPNPAAVPATTVPQTPAPAPAPVEPTAAEKAAKEALAIAEKEAPKEPTEKWEPSGDTFVDTLANGYLESGGSVAQFQALLNDVALSGKLTEGAKVELKKAFGGMAEALIPSIEQKAQAALEWINTERKAVFDAVGGEAKFTEMQKWASENLDATTRGFLSSALELGGTSAQLAVQQLKELMIKGGATVTGETFKANATSQGEAEKFGLSDYLAQRVALERKGDKAGVEALQAKARQAIAQAAKSGQKWR